MINNISIDQGDAKIPIDNDVEDIFLDLADEVCEKCGTIFPAV